MVLTSRLLPLLASVALTGSCATSPAPTPAPTAAAPTRPEPLRSASRKERVRAILPYNVRILVSDGKTDIRTGSGVCVSARPELGQSFVVTNAHVAQAQGLAQPRYQVLVDDRGEEHAYSAELVALGTVPEMDLAVLKVSGIALPVAPLADDAEIELGDDVVVAAAPFGKSLSLSGGMVSHVDYDRALHVPDSLKTDAPVGYGASGGGIYSLASGKLLAIVEGYRTAKVGFAVADQPYSFDVPMPGETFAAPTTKVRRFLQTHGLAPLLAASPTATAQASASLR